MRVRLLTSLFFAALLAIVSPARAADMNPGDSCGGFPAGAYRPTGGQENPDGAFVVCDGSIWQPILRYSSAGNAVMFSSTGLPAAPVHVWGEAIIGNQGLACGAEQEGALRYTSSGDLWEYCDGASWLDLASGGGTPAGSDREIQFNSGGALGADASFVYDASGNLGLGIGTPSGRMQVEGGDVVFLSNGGLVGIGTATPGSMPLGGGATLAIDGRGLGHGNSDLYIRGAKKREGQQHNILLEGINGIATPGLMMRYGANGVNFNLEKTPDRGLQIFMRDSGADDGTWNERLRLQEDGDLGIGTTPAVPLDVAGIMRAIDDAAGCTATARGALRFNSAGGALELCDGSAWGGVGGGGGSGLWSDSGSGYIEYDSALGGVRIGDVSGEPAPNVIGVTNLNDLGDVSVASPGDQDVLTYDTGTGEWIAGAGAAGDFIGLTDTPADYSGAAGQFAKVNATPDGLEFGTIALSDLPAIALNDLSDTSAGSPNSDDVLTWNGSNWVNGALTLSQLPAIALNDLSDATISSPASGEVLSYNGSNWVNQTISTDPAGSDRQIQFNSGGSFGADANFVYDASGNLGIGIGAPAGRMQVEGGDIVFLSNGGGNVGIGTASPETPLHVDGTTTLTRSVGEDFMIFKRADTGVQANIRLFDGGGDGLDLKFNNLDHTEWNAHDLHMNARLKMGNDIFLNGNGIIANGFLKTSSNNTTVFSWSANSDTIIRPYNATTSVVVQADEPSMTAPLMEWQDSSSTVLGLLTDTGNLGLGIGFSSADVNTKLALDGTLKLAYGGEACDASREGAIRYDAGTATFSFCADSGTGWESISLGSGSTLAGLDDTNLSSPASGEVLTFDGTDWVNQAASGGTPAGSDREIQFNSNGSFGADANFVLDASGNLGLGVASPAGRMQVEGGDIIFNSNGGLVGIGTATPGSMPLGGGATLAIDSTGLGHGNSDLYIKGAKKREGMSHNILIEGTGGVATPGLMMRFRSKGVNLNLGSSNRGFRIYMRDSGADDGTWNERLRLEEGGNLGIGTTDPQTRLDVAGTLKIAYGGEACDTDREGAIRYDAGTTTFSFCADSGTGWEAISLGSGSTLAGLDDTNLSSPADGEVLTYNNSTSDWENQAVSGDNLGDHTATQNILLNGNWLSNDGANEGVFVDTAGNVGIGTASPGRRLTVEDSSAQFGLDESDTGKSWHVEVQSNNFQIVESGVAVPFKIEAGAANNRLVVGSNDNVGIGDATPDHMLDVAGNIGLAAAGYLNFGDTDGSTGYGIRASDGVIECKNSGGSWEACAGGSGDNLGDHTATQNILLNGNWLSNDGGNEGVFVDTAGNVGVGDATPDHMLDVAGNIGLAAAGYLNFGDTDGSTGYGIRASDGVIECKNSGGSWEACAGGSGDNLGDHTATQNILLNGNWLSNDGGNEGVFVDTAGNVGVGDATPGAKLDVAGEVRMGNSGASCTASNEGAQRYNSTQKIMQFCDGSNWCPFAGCDTTPDAFAFTDLTDQATLTTVESDIVQITGITVPTDVSITGDGSPAYRICDDSSCSSVDHTWSSAGSIDNSQYLQLRLTTSSSFETTNSATVTVGTESAQWNVTTEADDKIVFVTSQSYDGAAVDSVSNADNLCQNLADNAGMSNVQGGTYRAWISDSTTSEFPAISFTQASGDYVLPTGTVVANGWTDLTDGTLDNKIWIDENGGGVGDLTGVWTGTDSTGEPTGSDCEAWTSNASGDSGTIGQVGSTDAGWTELGNTTCDTVRRLYCFEQ